MIRPLAVFDIDGTLVDSRLSIHEASCEAARVMGLPEPDYERVRQGVGLSLTEAMRRLEPDLGEADLARFVQAFQASFRRLYDSGHVEPLYDGAMEHLHRLKADGWRLALATGQNRRGVARNLARDGWADLFLSSHCAEDGPGKPDPAMLRAAMSACDASPETTDMIGDTAHDARGLAGGFVDRPAAVHQGSVDIENGQGADHAGTRSKAMVRRGWSPPKGTVPCHM